MRKATTSNTGDLSLTRVNIVVRLWTYSLVRDRDTRVQDWNQVVQVCRWLFFFCSHRDLLKQITGINFTYFYKPRLWETKGMWKCRQCLCDVQNHFQCKIYFSYWKRERGWIMVESDDDDNLQILPWTCIQHKEWEKLEYSISHFQYLQIPNCWD